VEDTGGPDTDDTLTIQSDTTNNKFVITDPGNVLATNITGATGDGTNTVEVPFSSVTGSQIIANTAGGDDKLTVDRSLGSFSKTIDYNGGANGAVGDELIIQGGGAFTTATYNYTNANDGNIDLDGWVIAYTGLEPIAGGSANNVIFNLPAGVSAELEDDGTPTNGISQLESAGFETTTFPNPATSLTINADAVSTIDVRTMDNGFNPGTINFVGTNADSTFRLVDAEVIPNTATLNITGSVILDGHDTNETIGSLAGDAHLITGSGTLHLSGNNTYTGTAQVQESGTLRLTSYNDNIGQITVGIDAASTGTLEMSGSGRIATSTTAAGTVQINDGSSLTGRGYVYAPVDGKSGSSITATSTFSLGDDGSTSGFAHDGALQVAGYTVTLRDADAAELGSSTTLTGGTLTAANGLALGAGDVLSGRGSVGWDAGASLVNQGRISADQNGQTLTFSVSGLDNQGTIEATSGGWLDVNSSSWDTDGGTVRVDGASSIAYLGGSFTADGATWTLLNSGEVRIDGTFTNTGQTTTLDTTGGKFTVYGGTITGGTLAEGAASSAVTVSTHSTNLLQDVTLDVGVDAAASSSRTRMDNVTLNGTATLGYYTRFDFQTTQTLGGTGEVVFQSTHPTYTSQFWIDANQTLTLGSGIEVRGGYGKIEGGSNAALVNQGQIIADTSGRSIVVSIAGLDSPGTLEASGGGTLDIDSSSWDADGSTVRVDGAGSIAYLGGSFTADGATWTLLNNGEVRIDGTFTNTGQTTTLDTTGGKFTVYGGTITGGTLAEGAAGSAVTVSTHSTNLLQDVTLDLGVDAAASSSRTRMDNVTLNGTATLGYYTRFDFQTTQTLGGTGEVVFQSTHPTYLSRFWIDANQTLTLGSGIEVRGGYGQIEGGSNAALVNQGQIIADSSGRSIVVSLPMESPGTLGASHGGTLDLNSNFTADGATWTLLDGGVVRIAGIFTHTGQTTTLDTTGGTFTLYGGTINGGTLAEGAAGSAVTLSSQSTSLLQDVTLGVGVDGAANYSRTRMDNVTLNGTATLGFASQMDFEATQTLAGTGEVVLQSSTGQYPSQLSRLWIEADQTLTLGSGIEVRGGYGVIEGGSNAALVSQGQIIADTSGRWLTVSTPSFDNQGTVRAQDGGSLDVTGSLSNYVGTTLTGGTWEVIGTSLLRLPSTTDVQTNAATILLDGAGSVFERSGAGSALASLSANAAAGSLTIRNSRDLTTPGDLGNAGSVTIGDSSTLNVTGTYTQSAGSTTLDNGTLAATVAVDIQSGSLTGIGTVQPDLTASASATVSPGFSPGRITVDGDVTWTAGTVFDVELNGTTAGTEHDQLQVIGDNRTVTLGGATLDLTVGYAPDPADSYTIIDNAHTGSSVSGAFDGLPEGAGFTVSGYPFSITYAGGDGNDVVLNSSAFDFDDAPSPYPTLLANNGARHIIAGPTLGANRDDESDGQPTSEADGDDTTGTPDEDGVTFGTIQVGQVDADVTVNVQNAPSGAKLDAWIDFNDDGNFGGPQERIAHSRVVSNGDNTIDFEVPGSAVDGLVYARFRLSTAGNLAPSGLAGDGEVEDHRFTIAPPASSSGLFVPETQISSDAFYAVYAVDVDDDGDADIATANGGRVTWFENDGTAVPSFAEHMITNQAFSGTAIHAGDLDGDGDVDLLGASKSDDEIAWYENDGAADPTFTPHSIYIGPPASEGGADPRSVYAADVDGDGDLDVLASFSGESAFDRVAWFENDGAANPSFTDHTISGATSYAFMVSAADMDDDGDLARVSYLRNSECRNPLPANRLRQFACIP